MAEKNVDNFPKKLDSSLVSQGPGTTDQYALEVDITGNVYPYYHTSRMQMSPHKYVLYKYVLF